MKKPTNELTFATFLSKQKQVFLADLKQCVTLESLTQLTIKYLGRKSVLITTFNRLVVAEKKQFSGHFQVCKTFIETQLTAKQHQLQSVGGNADFSETFAKQFYQFSNQKNSAIPGLFQFWRGQSHPLMQIVNDLHLFFQKLHFKFMQAPELTSVTANFGALNIGSNHPARNLNDCFFISPKTVLRTQTTNFTTEMLQVHYPQFAKSNFFAYTIGNVYRNDTDDATHTPKFMQLDGCMWGKKLNLAKLKGLLIDLVTFLFGKTARTRFRANYFPFTQPSFEMDLNCLKCIGALCPICKGSGWIEILGAGLIHHQVLKNCQISDYPVVLAFGIGIERLAMLKYQINDIRHFTNYLWTKEDHYAL